MKIANLIKSNNLGIAELLLRVFVSFSMIYHGYGKLTGIERYTSLFEKLGIEPAELMVILAGLGETLGGLALMFGLLTRLGASVTAFCMLVAFYYLGLPNGFNIVQGGYEYQITLILLFLFFIVQGAGKYSLDNFISRKFLSSNS